MDVKDILIKYLEENNFDGLYNNDECWCLKYNLCPCDKIDFNCKAGDLLWDIEHPEEMFITSNRTITIKEILSRYLEENGYEGLCNDNGDCCCQKENICDILQEIELDCTPFRFGENQ